MHAKLEVLQPDFDNLCPHIRKLDALESAIFDAAAGRRSYGSYSGRTAS
jgi:hypothetical protein